MPANLIGTVGIWGMDDENAIGIIIEGLDETSRNEKNYIKNEVGERVGRSDYDESIEIKLSGKLTSATPFAGQLGEESALSNVIATTHLQSGSGGHALIGEVKRGSENEGWKAIEVDIEHLPYFDIA